MSTDSPTQYNNLFPNNKTKVQLLPVLLFTIKKPILLFSRERIKVSKERTLMRVREGHTGPA